MTKPILSPDDAVALLKDGDTLAIDGSGGGLGEPDALIAALHRRFEQTGHPRDLTVIHATGIGDRGSRGISLLAMEGLCRRVIGGHWGQGPEMAKLAAENKVEAYNFPQGVLNQLYREIAAGRPGVITHVGLGTFVDPRMEGGKLNDVTKEDLVEVVTIGGREWLFYKAFPIDMAWIRGTTADEDGYISQEQEAATLGALAVAQAGRNSGGVVIAQVKRLAVAGSLPGKCVRIPGPMVDALVIHDGQWQTYEAEYNPAFAGEVRVPLQRLKPLPLGVRKVVARRAAMEIAPGALLNLGVGMPDGVAAVAAEEGISEAFTLTVEQGGYGGIPAGGVIFGAVSNPKAILDAPSQFDFYDGGGLDVTCLGMAQADRDGNVNVSKFGPTIIGTGGFVDISQGARTVVFCATFTAGGLQAEIRDGRLTIVREGTHRKFLERVDQITFSGAHARERGQRVLYVTERAVLELQPEGVVLTEIAPGIDLRRDVLDLMEFEPVVSRDLKLMDARLFDSAPMGLADDLRAKGSADMRPAFRQRLEAL
ncbi:MAG: acyl CoA:acetate/3-ketoacid CoA transferase [Sphingomonadaceae bacterium]